MKHELLNMDCESFLKTTKEHYDCIFMDPPDNLGLEYNGYYDQRDDYIEWLSNIVKLALGRANVVWVSVYHKHLFDLLFILQSTNIAQMRQFIWYFKFGQYYESDNPNAYRPVLRMSLYYQWQPIMRERVPSVREQIGDLRSTGKGRVPDDVWQYSRVTGSKSNDERRPWHPTQHPEAIYRRIAMQSVGADGTFVDLFAGTGTCFRALFDFNVIGVEIDPFYCQKIKEDMEAPLKL